MQRGMSALDQKGHQRTSSEAVLLVFRGPCCKPSNLQTMPGSPSLSHYMASMLWKCWRKIVTATTPSAWGGGHWQSARPGSCQRARSPRASEGGRSRQSSLECCPTGHSAYFVAFTGRFIHGNEVSPGNLCREAATVA